MSTIHRFKNFRDRQALRQAQRAMIRRELAKSNADAQRRQVMLYSSGLM
ncbi:MAG TPA: hypothetical protein H9902_13415 [Candidatus Stackebrandtia faecavium]|nr:hypothetical protein [Candidatus Stackebrandtia faecavium]